MTLSSCTVGKNAVRNNSPVPFSEVKISDSFWQPRLHTHATATVPACIRQCEQETHRIHNFAIAAGMENGKWEGLFYDDSDVYKMIEGAAYSLMNNYNPTLETELDSIIAKIAGAQRADGYLDTYYILGNYSERWTDMDKHEMYCCGHLIEAAIAYYNATGKRNLLEVAQKYADHIYANFGPGKRDWIPGHPEIELALVKLYRASNDKKYLELSHKLLEERGHAKATWSEKDNDYYQDLVPVSDLKRISGHAVRAMYLFSGMADYTAATGDTTYMKALNNLWDDVVNKKMYITGGIGSSKDNEGFTEPYDLPNEDAYCETCASVGMVFWNQRMNLLTGDSKYADIMEKAMYNGALAGVSLSGDRFFYSNPLYSNGDHHRQAWYGTACCPSQITRFLPSVGSYIYAKSEKGLWINLFVGSSTSVSLGKTKVAVSQKTNYPWDGHDVISVDPDKEASFTLRIRVPEWCLNYSLSINGLKAKLPKDKGYLVLSRKWRKGDVIDFNMEMPIKVIEADARVAADSGMRALQRGPIVYCMEGTDNPDFDNFTLTPSTQYSPFYNQELLGGIETIKASNGNGQCVFIPYYAWDNREAGKMAVWIRYQDK